MTTRTLAAEPNPLVIDKKSAEARNLEELYALHAPGAIRLACLITGDAHLAEDLVQDAFVKLAGRFRHLRSRDSFGAYLRTTIVNLSRAHYRRKRVERGFLEREPQNQQSSFPDVESKVQGVSLLQKLPIRQRTAIVLRYYEDLSEHQVADALGCSPNAAKALIARAMKTLREEMKGADDE